MCTMYITHSQKFFLVKKCNGLSHHEWTCGKHAQAHHRHHQLLHSFPAHDTQGKKAWQTGNGKANETHTHTTHIREMIIIMSIAHRQHSTHFKTFFSKFHPTLPFPTRLSFFAVYFHCILCFTSYFSILQARIIELLISKRSTPYIIIITILWVYHINKRHEEKMYKLCRQKCG